MQRKQDLPKYTKDSVVEVHEADVGRGDPDVEKIDDELVTYCIPVGLEALKLELALCLHTLLSPRLALKLFDLVGEATSLEETVYNAEHNAGEPELRGTLVDLLGGRRQQRVKLGRVYLRHKEKK